MNEMIFYLVHMIINLLSKYDLYIEEIDNLGISSTQNDLTAK